MNQSTNGNAATATSVAWTGVTGVPTATTSTAGVLSAADWNTFNNKPSTGAFVDLTTNQSVAGSKTFIGGLTSTGTAPLSLGADASAQTISFGTGAAVKNLTIGSTNTTSATSLNSGSGGINQNVNNNAPTSINTGSSTGVVTIGNSGNTTSINSGTVNLSGSLSGGNTTASTISGFAANINVQTGSTYTLLASDNGKIITLNNAASIALTVPAGLPAGFNCMIVQLGAGAVTITPSGVTVNNRLGLTKTAGTNAIATLIALSSSLFISSGDMN